MSTEVNLFRLVKEVTIILWIYLIMWLLEVTMKPAWICGTFTDEKPPTTIVMKSLKTEAYKYLGSID